VLDAEEWKRVFHIALVRKWREIDFGLHLVPAAVTFRSGRLVGLSTRDKNTFLYDSERGLLALIPIYYRLRAAVTVAITRRHSGYRYTV
jgi:hypothetical protein